MSAPHRGHAHDTVRVHLLPAQRDAGGAALKCASVSAMLAAAGPDVPYTA